MTLCQFWRNIKQRAGNSKNKGMEEMRQKKNFRRQCGLTSIEMCFVVAIIALIAAVAIPTMVKNHRIADNKVLLQDTVSEINESAMAEDIILALEPHSADLSPKKPTGTKTYNGWISVCGLDFKKVKKTKFVWLAEQNTVLLQTENGKPYMVCLDEQGDTRGGVATYQVLELDQKQGEEHGMFVPLRYETVIKQTFQAWEEIKAFIQTEMEENRGAQLMLEIEKKLEKHKAKTTA